MCGRYQIDDSPGIQRIVGEMKHSPLMSRWLAIKGVKTSGEVRPTDVAPVIATNRQGGRAVFPMKWGYTGRSLIINARSETAAEKPFFRKDWERHRCVIPGSWYYEWELKAGNDGKVHAGDKYLLQPKDSEVVWLCGMYRIEGGLPVFVILTRDSVEEIRFIHDRMPVMISGDRVSEWIRPEAEPEEVVRDAVAKMCWERAVQ